MASPEQLPLLRDPAVSRRLKLAARRATDHPRDTKDPPAVLSEIRPIRLQKMLATTQRKRLVIGAWSRFDEGWVQTEHEFLDLTKPDDWAHFFQPDSIEAMLAEASEGAHHARRKRL